MTEAVKVLHIAIIGAGMGGLATALALAKKGFTHIEVYESASSLGFVGAGIQMAPNMARVLGRLGCWEEIKREATNVRETSIRKSETNEELAHVPMPDIESLYGFPHMVGHRAKLAGEMYKACQKEPSITFFFATTVDKVTFSAKPSFTAIPRKGGEPYQVHCDVLLAADGIKSVVRPQMLRALGVDAEVVNSGQAAYRIMLKREDLEHDAELLGLLDGDMVCRWIGERRHIIAYPVAGKSIYNISSAHPDTNFASAPSASYTTKGSKAAMLAIYATFCPTVQKLLNLVPDGEVCEWKLRIHAPLPTWTYGSTALLGDACHPTLPHLNQGAAQAIEDAGVLSVVLARCPDPSPAAVGRALKVYERVRKERAELLVSMAAQSGRALHLGEGKAKEERDRAFKALTKGEGKGGPSPDKWADREVQRMIYGHDCVGVAEEGFEGIYRSLP
ncbi:FAD/NAD(P)-binding domain-containing protein [Aulographum hederae CBS 113979]|uniref:FAD/NAD(P)-binding domain-containing protein n=1 Tax=Aulographum hederae CBS 113979 TaxID=1176131 RepID=A0A6G1HA44_9PEZI|nr:FAD/NAD(P)-binding domain-containing protein [Aulographum hederae CBS 113979]